MPTTNDVLDQHLKCFGRTTSMAYSLITHQMPCCLYLADRYRNRRQFVRNR